MKRNNIIIQILSNENENKPLQLINNNKVVLNFEQVFVTELKAQFYCILHPLAEIEGVDSNIAFAFSVNEDGELCVVKDENISNEIFSMYYKKILTKKKE